MAINEVTFNSVNFWKDLGAALSAPVSYPIPAEVKELVKVKGATGSLTEAIGYYNNLEINLKFKVLFKRAREEQYRTFENIKRKINQIFNDIKIPRLSFSDIPYKYYLVKTVGVGSVTKISDYEAEFEVVFNCDPFLYLIDEQPITGENGKVSVEYNGDIPNASVVEVQVATSGRLLLSVNRAKILDFEGVAGETYFINKNPYSIVSDSKGKAVKSTGPATVLSPGINKIEIDGMGDAKAGTVTVIKKERYLG